MIDSLIKKNKELNKPNFFGVTASGISGNLCSAVGGWVEIGRKELTGTSGCLYTTEFGAYENIMYLYQLEANNLSPSARMRFNDDTGSHYASRQNVEGSVCATTLTNQNNSMVVAMNTTDAEYQVGYGYIENVAGQEKLGMNHNVNRSTAGECTAPSRVESVYKYDPASLCTSIDEVRITNCGSGVYAIGTQVIALGWDKDNTHSPECSFWQPLTRKTIASASTCLTTDTFAGKEWLMVNIYGRVNGCGNINGAKLQFNGDTCSNYAWRRARGGADCTGTNATSTFGGCTADISSFSSYIIRNQADKEKLISGHEVVNATAGECTVPGRAEYAWKWDNTSDQITSIKAVTANAFSTASYIQVWGSD
tara:strand:- start:5296 stop:6393 length:1098 start_codon:yes stop_codon:yes gene_type:complete